MDTLPEPSKMNTVPEGSQWLAGEGAGSWFHMEASEGDYYIARFSPEGVVECFGLFRLFEPIKTFRIEMPFQFTYLSHCERVSIIQDGSLFTFYRIERPDRKRSPVHNI